MPRKPGKQHGCCVHLPVLGPYYPLSAELTVRGRDARLGVAELVRQLQQIGGEGPVMIGNVAVDVEYDVDLLCLMVKVPGGEVVSFCLKLDVEKLMDVSHVDRCECPFIAPTPRSAS